MMFKNESKPYVDENKRLRSVVALFGSAEEARQAIAALHKSHFTHTWLGMTSLAENSRGDAAVTVESTGGFFSKTESLVDALVKHGVHGDTARIVESDIEPGSAVVTIDPKKRDASEATAIVREFGGKLPNESSFSGNGGVSEEYFDDGLDDDPGLYTEDTFYRMGGTLSR